MRYEEWQYGEWYDISQDGDIMVRRERGVQLGSVRVFRHTDYSYGDKLIRYYAEREFRSLIPFRAPKIWWRRIGE